MRKALASVAILAATLTPSAARTEIVEERPPVGGCTQGPTWDAVSACLAQARYAIKPLRQGSDWKLLELESQRDPAVRPEHFVADRMLALYVNATKQWRLGGHVSLSGSQYELIDVAQTTINKRDVWRFELGQAIPTRVPTNDSGASVPGLVRYKRTLYCSGKTPHCSDVYTACEVLVRGRAWYAFRGTAKPVDGENTIEIAGDRNRAGAMCRMPARVNLYLP